MPTSAADPNATQATNAQDRSIAAHITTRAHTTVNTVPDTPQACSVLLHDHRPDARAHETPAQHPHPRAAT
eukprot:2106932-Prymnesium_polylepis.1